MIAYGDKKQDLLNGTSREHEKYLPLMLKVYNNGRFTPVLMKANFEKDSFELS